MALYLLHNISSFFSAKLCSNHVGAWRRPRGRQPPKSSSFCPTTHDSSPPASTSPSPRSRWSGPTLSSSSRRFESRPDQSHKPIDQSCLSNDLWARESRRTTALETTRTTRPTWRRPVIARPTRPCRATRTGCSTGHRPTTRRQAIITIRSDLTWGSRCCPTGRDIPPPRLRWDQASARDKCYKTSFGTADATTEYRWVISALYQMSWLLSYLICTRWIGTRYKFGKFVSANYFPTASTAAAKKVCSIDSQAPTSLHNNNNSSSYVPPGYILLDHTNSSGHRPIPDSHDYVSTSISSL